MGTTDQTLKQPSSEPLFCMFCNVDLMKWSPEDRQSHYEAHLSNLDTLPSPTAGSRTRYSPSPAKSSRTKGISLSSRSAKDQFWYHSLEVEPPSNYTPGLIPLLRRMLLTSVERNTTRRAVLCYERAVHIYHEMWDAGWGCGYRNFMMLCAALMDQRMKPEYSPLIINPIPPGVSNLKVWIEEAWKNGFDPDGAEQLKGKLVGHNKWIGTAELYVAFTYRGIPSRLIDFDTPDGNVTPLLDWIKQYFDAQPGDHPISVQDKWRAATPVAISDRMPLILQHQGHSRTIIGYEIAKDGSTTLLTFDPAIRMTQLDIRRTALSSLNLSSKQPTGLAGDSKHCSTGRLAESLKKPFQTHGKRAGPSAEGQRDSSPKRLRTGSIGDDDVAEDNENTLDIRKVLKIFRVDRKKLAKNKKHQVLWCPMKDPLTESERQARREVRSEHA